MRKAITRVSCIIAVLLLFLGCRQDRLSENRVAGSSQSRPGTAQPSTTPEVQLEEFFVDSLAIGNGKQHKLTIAKFRTPDSLYVDIRFYKRQPSGWALRSSFHFQKDGLTDIDPVVADFNHDGLKDFAYVSAAAARGANRVQRLFIYDSLRDQLISIRNAENYPDLLYNHSLNCLDAFAVHGGCTTFFLRISGDSLREFASVDLADGLTVRTYDRQGKSKILYQDLTNKAEYVRYQNYHPLKAYE